MQNDEVEYSQIGVNIINKKSYDYPSQIDNILDSNWLKTTFLIGDKDLLSSNKKYQQWVNRVRYRTSADAKITSTAPGMNFAINPKPQFTRYADIRSKGLLGDKRGSVSLSASRNEFGLGMGHYYSEAFDDTAQRIYLRFGVPNYSPLSSLIFNTIDIPRLVTNNRGAIPSFLINIIDLFSSVFVILRAPLFALGMSAYNILGFDSRVVTLRTSMGLYWNTVENILNMIMTRRTSAPNILGDYLINSDAQIGDADRVNEEFIANLSTLMPDIFMKNGRVSVYALALKAQRAYNISIYNRIKQLDSGNEKAAFIDYPLSAYGENTGVYNISTDITNQEGDPYLFIPRLIKKLSSLYIDETKSDGVTSNSPTTQASSDPDKAPSYSVLNKNVFYYKPSGGKMEEIDMTEVKKGTKHHDDVLAEAMEQQKNDNNSYVKRLYEYMLAEVTEGAAFLCLQVEPTGSVSDSFSNSFKDNKFESIINSIAETVHDTVSGAAYAVSGIPLVGEFLKDAGSTVVDAAATAVSNLSFGLANPLIALLYNVKVKMPKSWADSSASIGRSSYKIKLVSPYGNAYSQLINIYLPLSALLAGAMPRAAGSNTYTTPFYCSLFDRGRQTIQFGMFESLNITRGTSNLAFTKEGQANAVEVDFSIANLDEIMTVDVTTGGTFETIRDILHLRPLGNIGTLDDYLNTLAGLSVYDQVYRIPRLRMLIVDKMKQIGKITDPAYMAFNTVGRIDVFKSLLGNPGALLSQ